MGLKSVRLGDELENRLEQAMRLQRRPASAIIREAIAAYCDRLLGERLDRRLSDIIGVVESDGGQAERSGDAFRELLRAREQGAR